MSILHSSWKKELNFLQKRKKKELKRDAPISELMSDDIHTMETVPSWYL
jgi:hypothetical protein